MKVFRARAGTNELGENLRQSSGLLLATVVFSVVVNLLMLTSPLYMMQVYDRVLGSGSEATLVALSLLVVFLFICWGTLEYVRGQVMSIVGARFQEGLDRRVFAAAMQRSAVDPNDPMAINAQRDLESIRAFLVSPVFIGLIDLPWTPFFLSIIFVFHPLMGWLSLAGGLVLVSVAILNQWISREPQMEAGAASVASERMADQLKLEAETLQALGMAEAGFDLWQKARQQSLERGIEVSGLAAGFGSLTKTFRQFLQSAMLGLGALVVLRGELSSGAMIAGSILLGRTLAPIEMIVGQWVLPQRAWEAWRRLSVLLARVPGVQPLTTLPRPKAALEVEAITVAAPGEQLVQLKGISFRLEPGQALGVIGPSGSGKSTLAKALTGVWRPISGNIRLDGASLDQYETTRLGRLIGYLPQRICLFDGTIADNIARLDPRPDSSRIVEAARKADAHEMIVRLPHGYDTRVSAAGGRLSGGQIQRIALARALYGDPALLILDEPNSNLDSSGSIALNRAIRTLKAEGKSILIMAHRPAAIQECDLLLLLEDGRRKSFGPRDQVLRDQVRNYTEIIRPVASGNTP